MNKLKWLYPGIGIKRWILLIIVGLFLVSSGLVLITDIHLSVFLEQSIMYFSRYFSVRSAGLFKIGLGLLFAGIGVYTVLWSLGKIEKVVSKKILSEDELVDILYEENLLKKGPRVVSLGGGTGLSNLLRGIKKYTSNITAIVTVADDGGSSGKLREEMGILPPGDIRNCLIALADIEPLMQKLMQYRFEKEGHLAGHSFGNLFIASMNEIVEGEFEEAVKESSKVLAIKGQVLPVTNENIRLGAVYADDSTRMGESVIPEQDKNIEEVFLRPTSCRPADGVLKAIKQAEIITLGPGSLYTSILPNLLVEGVAGAIKNSKAVKVYICNVMTQPGETDEYSVGDHVQAICDHVGPEVIDYVLVNTQQGSAKLRERYRKEGAYPVQLDRNFFRDKNIKIIVASLLSEDGYLRHDPRKTAKKIVDLFGGN